MVAEASTKTVNKCVKCPCFLPEWNILVVCDIPFLARNIQCMFIERMLKHFVLC